MLLSGSYGSVSINKISRDFPKKNRPLPNSTQGESSNPPPSNRKIMFLKALKIFLAAVPPTESN